MLMENLLSLSLCSCHTHIHTHFSEIKTFKPLGPQLLHLMCDVTLFSEMMHHQVVFVTTRKQIF